MAELIGGSGYDDVQDTTPSSPSIGDTWLDTSTDPPTGKIYADIGSGGQWIREKTSQRVDDNLDTTVSSRSSHSDPDPSGHIDADISSRATPSDAGGTTEIIASGVQLSGASTITFNEGGIFSLVFPGTNNAGIGGLHLEVDYGNSFEDAVDASGNAVLHGVVGSAGGIRVANGDSSSDFVGVSRFGP